MKKFVAVVVGAAFALGVSACGSETDPAYSTSETSSVSIPRSTDEIFADTVREGTSISGTDEEMTDLAGEICEAFDSGATFASVYAVMTSSGISSEDAGYFIGASIGAYCDEHITELE